MAFQLPPLPYSPGDFSPFLSAESFEYHHGKHHKAYIDKLNEMVAGTPQEKLTLEQIVKSSEGKLFNQAAQAWNHEFFWNCMTPKKGAGPSGDLRGDIDKTFGSLDGLKKAFIDAGVGQFGSGWVWLGKWNSGQLEVMASSNADNPLVQGVSPLLTADVWEHAYYIDHRNQRPKFLEAFWDHVDWTFVSANYMKS